MDFSSNILKYTTQTALCILIYFAHVTLELHITKYFCMYSILEAIKYFEKFGRCFFILKNEWIELHQFVYLNKYVLALSSAERDAVWVPRSSNTFLSE